MTELIDVFVHVIEADAGARESLREQWARWAEDVAPGADGWLGSTAGIADDGRFIGSLRFASAEGARRNRQRQEYEVWWRDLCDLLDGEVTVRDCADVGQIAQGASEDAGYVVIVQGRATDLKDVIQRMAETQESVISDRPILLGGYVVAHEDGEGFTEILYFRTEEEAEETGSKVDAEISNLESMSGYVTDLQRLKLRDPWLHSA
jgi:hypothetical protein